jgi:hypothetical protein
MQNNKQTFHHHFKLAFHKLLHDHLLHDVKDFPRQDRFETPLSMIVVVARVAFMVMP